MARVTEDDIAFAVLRIAAGRADGLCTFNRARIEIPGLVNLTAGDLALSQTRRREPMWHQLIRNIRSHHGVDGNYIDSGLLEHVARRGYKATNAGIAFLKKKGF